MCFTYDENLSEYSNAAFLMQMYNSEVGFNQMAAIKCRKKPVSPISLTETSALNTLS